MQLLYLELFKKRANSTVSLEAILQKWTHPYIIVNFMLNEEAAMIRTEHWELLMRLCIDFEKTMQGRKGLKVFFFISLSSTEPQLATTVPRPVAYHVLTLDQSLSIADLKKWFYSFIREDEDLFAQVRQTFFVDSQSARPLTMKLVERDLGRLISKCNRTENFIDYLQTL